MLYVWQRLLKVRLNTFQKPNILQFQDFKILSSQGYIIDAYPWIIFILAGLVLQGQCSLTDENYEGSSWWWWKADDLLNSRLLVCTELWCSETPVLTQAYHCGSSDKALPHPHTPPDTALELTVPQTLLCPLLKGAEVKPSAWPARSWHLMALSLSHPTVSDCDHYETLPFNFSSFSYTQENKPSALPDTALKNRSWMSLLISTIWVLSYAICLTGWFLALNSRKILTSQTLIWVNSYALASVVTWGCNETLTKDL